MTDFATAMAAVSRGERVRRDDWNRPLCVYRAPSWSAGQTFDGIWMKMKDGRIGAYTPSQCDMLADDWTFLDAAAPAPATGGEMDAFREAVVMAADYLDRLERNMKSNDVDMVLDECSPPSLIAETLRAALAAAKGNSAPPAARDMTPEERAECERITREMHAEADDLLKDRPRRYRAAAPAASPEMVLVPREPTEAMRFAAWFDQYKTVGGTDEEATELAKQRVEDSHQRRSDVSSYRAMLAAAKGNSQ